MTRGKKRIILIALAALLIGGGAVFAVSRSSGEDKTSDSTHDEGGHEQVQVDPDTGAKLKDDGTPISSTAEDPSQPATAVTPIITQAEDGDPVIVRAIIDGATNGTCTLTLTQGDHKIEKTAPATVVTSYAGCEGFDVPKSEFPSKGEWSAVVSFQSNTASGVSQTVKVNVQ